MSGQRLTSSSHLQCLPWNKNKPMMLLARPSDPTMTTSFGLLISLTLKNLSMASMKIEKQRASKKTPFTSAPRTSDLCHPYEFFAAVSQRIWETSVVAPLEDVLTLRNSHEGLDASLTAYKATIKDITSFSMWKASEIKAWTDV